MIWYPFKQAIFLCHMQRAIFNLQPPFHMQNSCQTVQYPMRQSNIPGKSCKAKMTMLLAHSSFPIRLHSILVKKPCSCKKKLDTWNIPVEKAQSSLFVVSKNPFTFWGTISFIQYERLVLSSQSIVSIILHRVLPRIIPQTPTESRLISEKVLRM